MSLPNFMPGECPISWKRASHRVLISGQEDQIEPAFSRLKNYLESYARENMTALLISDGIKLYLRASAKARKSIEDMSKYILDDCEINDRMYETLEGIYPLILLISPVAIIDSGLGTEYDVLDIKNNVCKVSCSFWRQARVFSIAAFAVVITGYYPFYEVNDAFTKLTLIRDEKGVSGNLNPSSYNDTSVRPVRLFQDMVAFCSETRLAWES